MKALKNILRLIIGGFFIFSGISKLVGMDAFEVYFFQLSQLQFNTSALLARLLVALEFFLGALLIFKLKWKFSWLASVSLLLVFSAFLAIQMMQNNQENCFCLGELIEFSASESLIKNAVLLIMLFYIKNHQNFGSSRKFQTLFTGLIAISSLAIPLIVSPPDFFYQNSFDARSFDQIALDENFEKNNLPSHLREGKKIINFYSSRCKFCKMSASKMSVIARRSNIPIENIVTVFATKNDSVVQYFYEETQSLPFQYFSLENSDFLKITRGSFPLTLLLENGEVKHKLVYRGIDEKRIVGFFED